MLDISIRVHPEAEIHTFKRVSVFEIIPGQSCYQLPGSNPKLARWLVVVQFEKLYHYQYQRLASRYAGMRAFRQTFIA